jgi:ABC-type transport system involved in multi-copper enzyme maturation permease subunit
VRAVLERDLLAQGTRPRAFLVRSVFAAAASFFVLTGLLSSSVRGASLDPDSFRLASWVTLLALVALAPSTCVDAVLGERLHRTLPLVLASPVGPRGFVAAKFLSRGGLVLALLATAVPALSVALLVDGGPFTRGLRFAVLALAVAAEMLSFGLLFSARCERLENAAALALVAPPVRWILTGFLFAWTGRALAPGDPTWAWVGYGLGPLDFLAGFGRLPEPPKALASSGWLLERPERMYLLSSLAFAFLALRLAARFAGTGEPAASPRPRGLAARRSPEPGREGRLLDWNPVLWKDFRVLRTRGQLLVHLALAAACFGALAVFLRRGGPGMPASVHFEFLGWMVTGTSILAAVQGASVLAQEKARGTLEFLRMAPLPPREFLLAKVLAAAPVPALGWCACAIHMYGAVGSGSVRPLAGAEALLLATVIPASYGLLGIRWGLAAPTPAMAQVGASLAILVSVVGCGWWLLAPLVLLLAEAGTSGSERTFAGTVVAPALLLGPPFFVLGTLSLWCQGERVDGFLLLFASLFLFGHLVYLFAAGRDLPLLFAREVARETPPPRSGRFFPSLRERIEKRRLEREERKRAVRAPSREWRDVPAGPPPGHPPRTPGNP